ncbi:hypothetical protein ACTAQJ_10700 [Arthrobacter sp. alpha11c]
MKATTESGMFVLLREDGTWVPHSQEARLATAGFRKSAWGSTPASVKALEENEPRHEEAGYMDFEVKLGRFTCLAIYVFIDEQLVRGKYALIEEYQNQNNFLSAFDELTDLVSKKYGAAKEQNTYWLNELYKDDYTEWGMAVSCGHLSRFSTWETQETTIIAAIMGENFDVSVTVEYSANQFAGLEEAIGTAALLEDL